MATAIFFGSRRINIPGAYSEIDASALVGLSPGAVGIVGLIGTAEGGKPQTVESQFSDAITPAKIRERYRSGDLKTAGQFCFSPSSDPAVPGGAQRIVGVKVNTALQGSAQLVDSLANPSIDLTAADWGLFTNQTNTSIAAGTVQGKKITIIFEDTTEVFDDVGGDAIMDVLYTPGAAGYTTMTGAINATSFTAAATKTAMAGLDSEVTAVLPGASTLDVVSTAAGDTTQVLTVYGLSATNVPISEQFTLNGLTPIVGTTSFSVITGGELSAATVGTVTVDDTGIPTTVLTFAPATTTRGLLVTTNTPAAGVVTVTCSADVANDIVVQGLSATGAAVSERFDMTTALTTPVVGTTTFSRITQIQLGDLPAANSIAVSLNAFQTLHAAYSTVQRVVDTLNADSGFTANALVSNPTTYQMATADYTSAVSLVGSAGDFFGDLQAVIAEINTKSQLETAARATGAVAVPANTTDPVFLTGGSEGATASTDWQSALDLLRTRRVNIVVPLTRDPAIHAMLLAHLNDRAGILRSEANGYIGLGTADGAGETKSSIKSQIQAIQNRNISAIGQEVQRFDPETGLATYYPPQIFGAIAAGMQAGSPIGEPLTFKVITASDIRQDASWNPTDDSEEMIDAGLMFAESRDGVGIRWVRSITTHLADDNVVFTEMSANESAQTSVYELRRQLELKIGKRGVVGTVETIKALALAELEDQVDVDLIVAFRSLTVEQIGDVFPVNVEISPVLPINFIPITVHVVAATSAAA
jgi:hypothetical protein